MSGELSLRQQGKKFTIMVIPHGDEETFNFRLSQRLVQWAGIILITVFICSVSIVYSLRQTRVQLANNQTLLAENRRQQEHILFLAKQTHLLQNQLASLQDLDNSIRVTMGIDAPAAATQNVAFTGVSNMSSLNSPVPLSTGTVSLAATILRTQQSIEQIRESIPETEDSLKDLERKVQLQREKEMATPSIRPSLGTITSGFGYRRSPFGTAREFHSGIDLGAARGTPVYATANGVVKMATFSGGYGNVIFVDHGFGFSTVYAHLSKMEVRVGQKVTKGQLVGLVGSTGRSTAPHLHYEVRVNGIAVNPYNYLTGGR